MQFRIEDCAWCVVVDKGRVEKLDLGTVDNPDVVVLWSKPVAAAILGGELRDDDVWRATTVSAMTATGPYTGPPAPLDLVCRPELDLLPNLPGATLCAQFRFPVGPFGAVRYALRFDDGRVVDEFLGEREDVDVRIEMTYRNMALVRAGEITILDALEGGSVTGEVGALMAFGGILESPEYQRAQRATGRHAIALSVLGELNADEAFRAALQGLVESAGAR